MSHNGNNIKYDELLQKIDEQHRQEIKKIEDSHRRDVRRTFILLTLCLVMFVLVVGVALFFIDSSFIAELRTGNISATKNTDFLEIVLPIVGVVIIAIIAFLGMNRLKDMDTQMDRMQSNVVANMEKEIKRINALRQDLSDHIEVAISTKTTDFSKEFSQSIEDKFHDQSEQELGRIKSAGSEALNNIDVKVSGFSKQIGADQTNRDSFDSKYSWLLANKEVTEKLFLKEIASVSDVHKAVESLWNSKERPTNIIELTQSYVEKVTVTDSKLRGGANSYHNLAAECSRHSLDHLACDVCETGLKYFPKDIDLLADLIQYATKIGNFSFIRTGPLSQLLSIDKSLWNWRAFDFIIDFYVAEGSFAEAKECAREFIKYIPSEERGYSALAQIYRKQNCLGENGEKVIGILQDVLQKGINCPICANFLAEILGEYGRLDEALVAANRAIAELAQEQPSVDYAFVFYQRALIQDRMAFREKASGEESAGLEWAQKASIDYKVVLEMLPPIQQKQAYVRLHLLSTYFDIDSYDNIDPDKLEAISQLLSMIPDSNSSGSDI